MTDRAYILCGATIVMLAMGGLILTVRLRELRLEVKHLRDLILEIGNYASLVHNLVAARIPNGDEQIG